MQPDYQQMWNRCLELVRDNVSQEQYECWFSPLRFMRFENETLTVACPSQVHADYIEDKLITIFGRAVLHVFGKSARLVYDYPIVQDDPSTNVRQGSGHPSPAVKPAAGASSNPFKETVTEELDCQLNPTYTFENYCISRSNKVAGSIGEAISKNPKHQPFNPLFVFGPCGVGKTHLIQAIGIRIKEQDPRARVLYITARLFESQFTTAVQRGKLNDFIRFYQSIETLIIDDIQDLTGKEKTQGAFFHIFNHLKQNGKQIIMSSDCCPSDLDGMAERLLSRFKSGMTVKLEKPDLELRRDVLERKALLNGVALPHEVMEFIISNVTESIRELEGVMTSLVAYATVLKQDINVDLARLVLSNSVKINKRTINFEAITKQVSAFYNIKTEQIFASSRKREISDARQMVMYLAKKHTKMPLKTIGLRLNRTHATVIYAIKLIDERLPLEKKLQEDVASIEQALMSV